MSNDDFGQQRSVDMHMWEARVELRILERDEEIPHRSFTVKPNLPITIGRGSTNAGRIPSRENAAINSQLVSRNHCQLKIGPFSGHLQLVDVASSHGTFVNNVRLPRGQLKTVQSGDLIALGQTLVASSERSGGCTSFIVTYTARKTSPQTTVIDLSSPTVDLTRPSVPNRPDTVAAIFIRSSITREAKPRVYQVPDSSSDSGFQSDGGRSVPFVRTSSNVKAATAKSAARAVEHDTSSPPPEEPLFDHTEQPSSPVTGSGSESEMSANLDPRTVSKTGLATATENDDHDVNEDLAEDMDEDRGDDLDEDVDSEAAEDVEEHLVNDTDRDGDEDEDEGVDEDVDEDIDEDVDADVDDHAIFIEDDEEGIDEDVVEDVDDHAIFIEDDEEGIDEDVVEDVDDHAIFIEDDEEDVDAEGITDGEADRIAAVVATAGAAEMLRPAPTGKTTVVETNMSGPDADEVLVPTKKYDSGHRKPAHTERLPIEKPSNLTKASIPHILEPMPPFQHELRDFAELGARPSDWRHRSKHLSLADVLDPHSSPIHPTRKLPVPTPSFTSSDPKASGQQNVLGPDVYTGQQNVLGPDVHKGQQHADYHRQLMRLDSDRTRRLMLLDQQQQFSIHARQFDTVSKVFASTDRESRQALRETKGNIDLAYEQLMQCHARAHDKSSTLSNARNDCSNLRTNEPVIPKAMNQDLRSEGRSPSVEADWKALDVAREEMEDADVQSMATEAARKEAEDGDARYIAEATRSARHPTGNQAAEDFRWNRRLLRWCKDYRRPSSTTDDLFTFPGLQPQSRKRSSEPEDSSSQPHATIKSPRLKKRLRFSSPPPELHQPNSGSVSPLPVIGSKEYMDQYEGAYVTLGDVPRAPFPPGGLAGTACGTSSATQPTISDGSSNLSTSVDDQIMSPLAGEHVARASEIADPHFQHFYQRKAREGEITSPHFQSPHQPSFNMLTTPMPPTNPPAAASTATEPEEPIRKVGLAATMAPTQAPTVAPTLAATPAPTLAATARQARHTALSKSNARLSGTFAHLRRLDAQNARRAADSRARRSLRSRIAPFMLGALAGGVGVFGALVALPERFF